MSAPGEPPLIVFDGLCGLCSASAEFVLRRDRRAHFLLSTAQSPAGRAAYLAHQLDPDAMTTMVVVENGKAHTESDAVLKVLTGLGWPWRAAGIAHIVPRFIRNPVNRWVARNRYRWVKRRETCWLPGEAMRDRVV